MTAPRRLLAAALVVLLVLAAFLGFRDSPNKTGVVAPTPITADGQPAEELPVPIGEFPEEELRSALTNLCSGSNQQADDKEWTAEEIKAATDELNELRRTTSDQLSVSSSTEHLHLAALLEDDSTSRIKLLDRAISHSPNNAFLLWRAVQICSEERNATACNLADWERQLLMIDGQNSESWVRIAANRYTAGETDAALEAMQHAATSAETRIYWTETIEMAERGFAAGSGFAFPERAGMAFGIAAMNLPRYGDFTTMCKEQSSLSAEWAQTCLAYGELAENQGKTEIGVAVGRSIQKVALDALGEIDKAAEVERRLQARRQERLNSTKGYNPSIERLVFSNPTLFSTYLAAIRSAGEEAARRRMIAEIERLIEQRSGLACE